MNIKSPCIFVCNYENNLCTGCYRTIEEIIKWNKFSDDEKLDVLKRVSDRKLNNNDYYGDTPLS